MVPAGVLVELLDTTLHSTPIHTHDRDGCRVVVFAPRRSFRLNRKPGGEKAAVRRSTRLIKRLPDRIRTLCGSCSLKLHSAARLRSLPEDF